MVTTSVRNPPNSDLKHIKAIQNERTGTYSWDQV